MRVRGATIEQLPGTLGIQAGTVGASAMCSDHLTNPLFPGYHKTGGWCPMPGRTLQSLPVAWHPEATEPLSTDLPVAGRPEGCAQWSARACLPVPAVLRSTWQPPPPPPLK